MKWMTSFKTHPCDRVLLKEVIESYKSRKNWNATSGGGNPKHGRNLIDVTFRSYFSIFSSNGNDPVIYGKGTIYSVDSL